LFRAGKCEIDGSPPKVVVTIRITGLRDTRLLAARSGEAAAVVVLAQVVAGRVFEKEVRIETAALFNHVD